MIGTFSQGLIRWVSFPATIEKPAGKMGRVLGHSRQTKPISETSKIDLGLSAWGSEHLKFRNHEVQQLEVLLVSYQGLLSVNGFLDAQPVRGFFPSFCFINAISDDHFISSSVVLAGLGSNRRISTLIG